LAGIIRCARDRAAPALLIHLARGLRDVARVHGIGIGTTKRTLASASPTRCGRIAASPHGSKPRVHCGSPPRLSSWATPAPLLLALGKGSWGRNKLSLCRKVDEAKIAALLFAPGLPSSPSCRLLFLLACSIFHLPSSALDPRTTSSQFTTTKIISAINSYCLQQLQTLTGLIAVSPVWRTTACSSRGAPQSSAAATPLSPPIIHRKSLRTKVADVLESAC
jgi:hypothetical protein